MSTKLEKTQFLYKAKGVSLLIGISRILGYLRDMVFASIFGATALADAFFVAFMIPNTLRRFLAEGGLTPSFVPVFSKYLACGKEEAKTFSSTLFFLLLLILLLIQLCAIFLLPIFLKVLAPGFLKKGIYPLALRLAQIMFPYIIFVSLSALCMGMLNTMGNFTIPFLSPIIFNLFMIFSLLFFCKYLNISITILAFTVVAAGLFQLFLNLFALPKYNLFPSPPLCFSHPGLLQTFSMLSSTTGVFLLYQTNFLIDKALASLLQEGAISSLYYANRLIMLPISLFGVALSTTSLPQLSMHAAKGEKEEFAQALSLGIRVLLFLGIPATTGLIVFGRAIIRGLFQRGAFSAVDTENVYTALFFYAFGVVFYKMQHLLVNAFYALGNPSFPLKIIGFSLLLNTAGSIILMYPLRQGGIALATALSASFAVFLLCIKLQKMFSIKWKEMKKTFFYTIPLTGICIIVCFCLQKIMKESMLSMIISVLGAVFTLIFLSKMFKIQELEFIWKRR